jgi:hypothetical protein
MNMDQVIGSFNIRNDSKTANIGTKLLKITVIEAPIRIIPCVYQMKTSTVPKMP